MESILWYKNPPSEWMEGLPIGNGRLAAMIWGDTSKDVITLNHEWLWRGVNRDRDNIPAHDMLEMVRELLRNGDFFRATSMANTFFGGTGGISNIPSRVDAYQPAGELCFSIKNVDGYERRELDILKGVVTTRRKTRDGHINSTFIAHPEINNIICRWSGEFSGELFYTRTKDEAAVEKYTVNKNKIEYSCSLDGGIFFKTEITVETDGNTYVENGKLIIEQAKQLTAFINIATEIKGIEKELEDYPAPFDKPWDEILSTHEERFLQSMDGFRLTLKLPENTAPTDQRIENIKQGGTDISLPLLYFNYGRYLLVSSSVCGELPANLQGKWNNLIDPPWKCDYHFNINLQMNYWAAESVNMGECVEALIQYVERFIPHARKAAKDLYGCRGVYLPLQTDAWGRATPEAFGWAVWIGAAPWIAQHFWWHYIYNGKMKFLRERAYPFFKEVARFYEDYLVEDENGVLQIMPSQSPENRFEGTGHFPVSIGISSAMDVQLAYDALRYAIESSKILDIDREDRSVWEGMVKKLPEFKIGSDGRLLEWDEERVEVEPGHRHLSHLYGLYPSDIFNPIERPEQYYAAARSLEYRLSKGGGHTGWSRAWVACLAARLGDGKLVWEHLNALIKDFATVSLLDLHPPRIFQIDGNLGAVAAVTESIAQYWGGKLHLLRALPKEWSNGSVRGLKVPGGHTISFTWQNGIVEEIKVTIGFSKQLIISMESSEDIIITGSEGEAFVYSMSQG